jgi:hypothetical protein
MFLMRIFWEIPSTPAKIQARTHVSHHSSITSSSSRSSSNNNYVHNYFHFIVPAYAENMWYTVFFPMCFGNGKYFYNNGYKFLRSLQRLQPFLKSDKSVPCINKAEVCAACTDNLLKLVC